ncbi:MAG: thioredoxin domain-containing protein [Sphingomicrobium sp.]
MRLAAIAVTAALCVVPIASSAAKTPPKSAAKSDWSRTFSITPDGGFRMGNPKAKLAIVEYGSLTCPHCRHFAQTAVKPLVDQYVRSGKASYEYRSFVLNGIDLAATLVARCRGPAHFFPMAERLYATQPVWVEKVSKLPQDEQDKLQALPQDAMMVAVAKVSGLLPVAAAQGISPAQAEACLKDQGAADGLMKIERAAADLGVRGTPTFYVNGKEVAAHDWATLEPFLEQSGG